MSVRTLHMSGSNQGPHRSRFELNYYEYQPAQADLILERYLEDYVRRASHAQPVNPTSYYSSRSQASDFRGSSFTQQYPNGYYPGTYTGVTGGSHISSAHSQRRIDYHTPSAIDSRAPYQQRQILPAASSHTHRPLFRERRSSDEYDEGRPLTLMPKSSASKASKSSKPKTKKTSSRHHERARDDSVGPEDSISQVSYEPERWDYPARGRTRTREGDRRSVVTASTVRASQRVGGGGCGYEYEHGQGTRGYYETVDITPYR